MVNLTLEKGMFSLQEKSRSLDMVVFSMNAINLTEKSQEVLRNTPIPFTALIQRESYVSLADDKEVKEIKKVVYVTEKITREFECSFEDKIKTECSFIFRTTLEPIIRS